MGQAPSGTLARLYLGRIGPALAGVAPWEVWHMKAFVVMIVGIALGVASWLSRDKKIDGSQDQPDLREHLDH
jgi:hypothetical protein